MSDLPLLYSFRRCPYAMRARMALAAAGQACRLREVVLRDKPAEMLAASEKGTVPVLVLAGGEVVDESLDIMRWALAKNDRHGWLVPDLAAQLALIEAVERDFKGHLDRYKYPTRYRQEADAAGRDEEGFSKHHRTLGLKFLDQLNTRIDKNGQLIADLPRLADIAIFPFVRQFANTDRVWFDQTAPAPLVHWLDGHLRSDLFRRVMTKYDQWRTGVAEPVLFG